MVIRRVHLLARRLEAAIPQIWAGIDAGKAHHHCVVIDTEGTRLLSRKVANDEVELLGLIADVVKLSDGSSLTWATDLNHGGSALLIALLLNPSDFTCPLHPV